MTKGHGGRHPGGRRVRRGLRAGLRPGRSRSRGGRAGPRRDSHPLFALRAEHARRAGRRAGHVRAAQRRSDRPRVADRRRCHAPGAPHRDRGAPRQPADGGVDPGARDRGDNDHLRRSGDAGTTSATCRATRRSAWSACSRRARQPEARCGSRVERGACGILCPRCPDPWCSGPTCQPVTLEIAGSNPVGSARASLEEPTKLAADRRLIAVAVVALVLVARRGDRRCSTSGGLPTAPPTPPAIAAQPSAGPPSRPTTRPSTAARHASQRPADPDTHSHPDACAGRGRHAVRPRRRLLVHGALDLDRRPASTSPTETHSSS